jgi:hypothetical protein
MQRGRPKSETPTYVLTIRVPRELRDRIDRQLDRLETHVGIKASRNDLIRHAIRRYLDDEESPPDPARSTAN